MILPKVRDPRFITVRRGGSLQDDDHHLLAVWAADCAQHVLHHFEQARPGDDRPRRAIDLGACLGAWSDHVGRGPHGGRACERRGERPERGSTACRVRCRPGRGGGPRGGPRARCCGLRDQGRPGGISASVTTLVAWSASGSAPNFPTRSANSCSTTNGCATSCAGSPSIAERLSDDSARGPQPETTRKK